MTNTKPFNRYKIETYQRLITTADVIDRESGQVVASGETVLSPNDSNDPKLGREIATGRAFKQLLRNIPLTSQDDYDAGILAAFEQGKIRERNQSAQNDQEGLMDAFLEGVRVGHSQHPEISRHISQEAVYRSPLASGPVNTGLFLSAPPVALPVPLPAPTTPPCYSKLSYEPGDRVQHIMDNDPNPTVGKVINKISTDLTSRCGDKYNVNWGSYGVYAYPLEYLIPAVV